MLERFADLPVPEIPWILEPNSKHSGGMDAHRKTLSLNLQAYTAVPLVSGFLPQWLLEIRQSWVLLSQCHFPGCRYFAVAHWLTGSLNFVHSACQLYPSPFSVGWCQAA